MRDPGILKRALLRQPSLSRNRHGRKLWHKGKRFNPALRILGTQNAEGGWVEKAAGEGYCRQNPGECVLVRNYMYTHRLPHSLQSQRAARQRGKGVKEENRGGEKGKRAKVRTRVSENAENVQKG